jgi:hypothetical protein
LGCVVVVHERKVSPEPVPGKGRAKQITPAMVQCALGEGCGCGLRHEGAAPGHRDLGRRDGCVDVGPRLGSPSKRLVEANSGSSGRRQNGWTQARRGSRRRLTEGVACRSRRSFDGGQPCFARRRQVGPWRRIESHLRELAEAGPNVNRRMGSHDLAGPRPSVSPTPRGSRSEKILRSAPAGGRHREPAAYACEAASRCCRRRRARR